MKGEYAKARRFPRDVDVMVPLEVYRHLKRRVASRQEQLGLIPPLLRTFFLSWRHCQVEKRHQFQNCAERARFFKEVHFRLR